MPTKHKVLDEDGAEFNESLTQVEDKDIDDENHGDEEDPIGKSTKKRTFHGKKPPTSNADNWYSGCGYCITILCCGLCVK